MKLCIILEFTAYDINNFLELEMGQKHVNSNTVYNWFLGINMFKWLKLDAL
jgi:hypothetical protein